MTNTVMAGFDLPDTACFRRLSEQEVCPLCEGTAFVSYLNTGFLTVAHAPVGVVRVVVVQRPIIPDVAHVVAVRRVRRYWQAP